MDHVLARIRGAKMDDIKSALKADAQRHAELGMVLRHVWRNANDPDEILFIFTTPDLSRAMEYLEAAHAEARKNNPGAVLPEMLFLKSE